MYTLVWKSYDLILGLNSLYTPVLYNLYFLSPQFYFWSNLVPMVYEKMKMVPPSNFPSKTMIQPCHPTGFGIHARHLSPSTPQPSYVLMKIHKIHSIFLKRGKFKNWIRCFLLSFFPKCLKILTPNPNQFRPNESPQIKLRNWSR